MIYRDFRRPGSATAALQATRTAPLARRRRALSIRALFVNHFLINSWIFLPHYESGGAANGSIR
jgi:hypothetical protein